MKNFKKLLIVAFCFALVLSTTTIPSDYEINPCGHIGKGTEEY